MTLGASLTIDVPGQRPRPAKSAVPPPLAPISNVYLSFQGVGFSSGKVRGFDAICGASPPTPVGGYGKWAEIARPLQDSWTIYQGRTAAALKIDIIFGSWSGGWQTDDTTGGQIADQIDVLEWMGGQGFHAGPTPVVYVWSRSSHGGADTELIPRQYRGMPWIVSDGIEWGVSYRNPSGLRVWQEATFTLKNYLNLSAPPPPDTNVSGGYYVTRGGRDTPLLIAGAPDVRSPMVEHQILAGRIAEDPANNPCKGTSIRLRGKGLRFRITHGTRVWIPGHQAN